jgi:prepilin-type N-terminal cleavage/methylation domain-containing protein
MMKTAGQESRCPRGFTLAEMLTVLSIIVILSLIAITSTSPFIARSRVRYAARQAHAAILQARHYAIATNSTASVVIYSGERFCVVTNAQFEPIDAPVVLPVGIAFRPAVMHLSNLLKWTDTAELNWAQILGDGPAAYAAGYRTTGAPSSQAKRPVCVVTFQRDGTVRYVTPSAASAKTGGSIVICVGGYEVGRTQNDLSPDADTIVVTGSAAFESRGVVCVNNEIVAYQSIVWDPTSNRTELRTVSRGIYTARRTHSGNSQVFGGWNTAILVIFPLTGAVVQAI